MNTLNPLLRNWQQSFLVMGVAALLGLSVVSTAQAQGKDAGTRVPVVFSGGHETDPRDRGRPVILVASALGVPVQVFRDAFRHVHPAPAGSQPDPQQVRENKDALLTALGPYGVTNDRLDSVSNHYRYVRSRGELWPTTPAVACALVKNGVVTSYVVIDGGSGYSSPPVVTVPGFATAPPNVQLSFSKTFEKNGSVASISVAPRSQK